MLKHLPIRSFAVMAAAFAATLGAYAATPISDAASLAAIGNDLAGVYELTADITLTGQWTPIGNNDTPFTGTFDGNGHTITGLTCTDNGNWVGLFGTVTGTVKNLAIVDADIYGNEHVGIAAGRVRGGGKVENVFTAGYINGRDHVGGIVGDAGDGDQSATVRNCLSSAYVYARDYQAGGIAGWTKGTVTIENNIFMGEAYCPGWAAVGGIVGFIEDGTTTVNNNVNLASKLTGNPDGNRETHGIVGSLYNDNSHLQSSGNLTSAATVIYNMNNGSVVDQSGMSADYNGTRTSVENLKLESTYTAIGFTVTNWKLTDGNYPVLSFMTAPVASVYSKEIATPADMAKLSKYPTGDFVLTADIDMNGVSFSPISKFLGNLDGQGHWIRNLSYDSEGTDKVALFAQFGGQYITNLGFENVSFKGSADVAAVVGETLSSGVISNVVVANSTIQGRDHVAAIVGKLNNGATIQNCLSNAVIQTREHQASGIAGVGVNGTIDKCIFCGTVSKNDGSTNLAGIVSLLDDSPVTIKNCLAAGASYANANTGDDHGVIVNKNGKTPTLTNNYVAAYSLLNGNAVTGDNANDQNGALATAAQVRSQEWYANTLGFDFNKDWKFFNDSEGSMLPVLSWMEAPLNTVIFNLPAQVDLAYENGTECWSLASVIGSWGQAVTMTQNDGDTYAHISGDNIFAGNSDGKLTAGGTANFTAGFGSISTLFNLSGSDSFAVKVVDARSVTEISNADDFKKISDNLLGKYILTADIDLADADFNGFCNNGSSFSGTLDGNGYTVKNFKLSFDSGSDHGLFGKTSGATIKNIAFAGFTINGTSGVNHVGLIGQGVSTSLESVAIVGDVTGDDHVGLVAGDADGIVITNCYAKGTVNGGTQVGGFFGCTLDNGCTIDKCLSNVNVTANHGWAGGFIGLIDKGNSEVTITNSVSIGNCSSSDVAAPFIAGNGAGGTNAKITFTGNLYNSQATMTSDHTDWPGKNQTLDGGNVVAATPKTSTELTDKGTYTANSWDFDNVWTMGQDEYKYPVLSKVIVNDLGTSGIKDVISGVAKSNVVIAGANGKIIVSGLAETAAITVYTASGAHVASVVANDGKAVVAVPARGFYIVSVAAKGMVNTAKVTVR